MRSLQTRRALLEGWFPDLVSFVEKYGVEKISDLLDQPGLTENDAADLDWLPFLQGQVDAMTHLTAVMAQCRDVVVDAPLHVFWAQSGDESNADTDDWLAATRAAGASTVTSIPGDHVSILDARHCGTIADVIGRKSSPILSRLRIRGDTINNV
jgi:hypothetical protein